MSDDPLPALRRAADDAWLVGGALRDRLLGRPTADFDVAVKDDPERVARVLGRSAGGHAFALSEGFGAWRVVSHGRTWQVDLLPVAGETIEADLAQRDLTINAIAEPLSGGQYVDPFGGLQDLRSRRLRMVSSQAFEQDPLRTLRLVRLACELGFEVDAETARIARRSAPRLEAVAPERTFSELKRTMISERALEGLRLMDALGITEVVLPELSELHGVEQSRFHHLDVYDHTLSVLAETIALELDPEPVFGGGAPALRRVLDAPLADNLTRGQAMRFGALLHDIAKARTRSVTPEGRVAFIGHDEAGATIAAAVLGRLRASGRLTSHVAALTRHHLRLGFLVHETPLSRHAIYHYLRSCEPVQVDVTVLSVADRLATRGSGSEQAIARHLELARQLLGEALTWVADPPRPPLPGDQLARALGIQPGPSMGPLLRALEEARFAGEIATPEEAISLARQLLDAPG